MSLPLLVVDDSRLARRQVVKALPADWDVDITLAENGAEAIEYINRGQGEVVLLDLTMPIVDGYGVLETIKSRDLPAVVIVISGDIQPEAEARVKQLGALAFLKKPVDPETLKNTLKDFGLYTK
ncbi:response regulator [Reinekea thalattae]|uniref:Response regulator n=1 Tax=Reinekea thalattae TaxID=2593301 RepID=A0A5C8ZAY6_9GAMM|nr:response regulator [Reinekea thalattae]TXR54351.1 response regulator [Reinekea thalattae]